MNLLGDIGRYFSKMTINDIISRKSAKLLWQKPCANTSAFCKPFIFLVYFSPPLPPPCTLGTLRFVL